MRDLKILIHSLCILLLIQLTINKQKLNPQLCDDYYSSQILPIQCTNATNCYFQNGLHQLVSNKTIPYPVLCLNLTGYYIQINYTDISADNSQHYGGLFIYADTIKMDYNYSLICYGQLVMIAQRAIVLNYTYLTGSKIYMTAQQYITIQGSNFTNQSTIQTQCSCYSLKKQCYSWNFSYPQLFTESKHQKQDKFNIQKSFSQLNYTLTPDNSITLIAHNSINITSSCNIRYSIVGIFSQNIGITSSKISTSGLGYPSDSGQGCGYFDYVLNQLLGCMGSGGSHGGFGGNSSPQNCFNLVSSQPYDSIEFPIEPGSGGGFFLPNSRESSSGGGIINIQGQNINIQQSYILAQGKNGIQAGGGGAGGTISIDYAQIFTNMSVINANGGNGDKMGSSGSGGRIRFWNHQWRYQNQTNININFSVLGGIDCNSNQIVSSKLNCGEKGTIYTSPCRSGSQLSLDTYVCVPCPVDTYQMSYGYTQCIRCPDKPTNSYWVSINVGQSFSYNDSCRYICNQSRDYSYNNVTCQTQYQVYQRLYSKNIYLSLTMIGIAIFIYLLALLIKRLRQEQFLSFDDPNLSQAYGMQFFRLQDLPYHQTRLYLIGENHPFNPWRIIQQEENNSSILRRDPISRINHITKRVIRQINNKAKYSSWKKILISILRYTYYPLSRIILNSMRKTKARLIFEEVNKWNKKIPEFQQIGIKFHVKPNQTVASLQFFNYSKSVLDFYVENYFPIYILLQRAPFTGYSIDFSDPFLQFFINEIVQKEGARKSIQQYLNELNKLLKNPDKMLQCLNFVWKLSEINPKYQAFLWQPTNKALGIERLYKIDKKQPLYLVFNCENSNNSHFQTNQNLTSIYIPQIQYLKHKFNIRKDLASDQGSSSFCMIDNSFNEKILKWLFGIITTLFFIASLGNLFLTVFIQMEIVNCQGNIIVGFIIYMILWPLSDFVSIIMSYSSIATKNQYMLADAISFNIFAIIKSTIIFFVVLPQFLASGKGNRCFQANFFIWLTISILGLVNLLMQIMWRAKIIPQSL